MKTKTTRKFHVVWWESGWQQAVSPRRTLPKAKKSARHFAGRYPHLKPISILRETVSVATVAQFR